MTTTQLPGLGHYAYEATLGNVVANYVGEFADDYDLGAICDAYRDAINEHLSDAGISLHGDDFYATAPVRGDADELIREALEAPDLGAICAEHEWATIVDTCHAGMAARDRIKECVHDLVPSRYSEADLARRMGVDRMTVRNWLGKR